MIDTASVRLYAVHCTYTHRVSKNVPPSTCYNLDTHDPITIIFGRSVAEKVRNQTMLCFPTSPISIALLHYLRNKKPRLRQYSGVLCMQHSPTAAALSLYRRFLDNHFPADRRFPDKTFPGQTFPGQVILRNFHVHNVCEYQLYIGLVTRYVGMERLLMCACRPAVSIRGLFRKACSPTMGKA